VSPDGGGASIHTYEAYRLTIRVPFPCPALSPAGRDAMPDVVVTEGEVSRDLSVRSAGEAAWDAAPGKFLLRGGRRSGRFLVDGGQVILERNRDADDVVLARHFTDRVLAALLRQRGLLVLHASAALTPYGVVAIGGESGAGKSTTLAVLLERGCAMFSDDVTALRIDPHHGVEVLPGSAQMHLTEVAAGGLGLDIQSIPLQPWRRMKAAVPTHDRMAKSAAPLRALFRLGVHRGQDAEVVALSGTAKFDAIQGSIYGPMFPEEGPGLFSLAATAASVDIFEVRRPQQRWSVAEIADAVLAAAGRRLP
jgi:hypothetical protein